MTEHKGFPFAWFCWRLAQGGLLGFSLYAIGARIGDATFWFFVVPQAALVVIECACIIQRENRRVVHK